MPNPPVAYFTTPVRNAMVQWEADAAFEAIASPQQMVTVEFAPPIVRGLPGIDGLPGGQGPPGPALPDNFVINGGSF